MTAMRTIFLYMFGVVTKTLSLCDSGWIEEASLCYKVFNEYKTFRDAINLCQQEEADLMMPITDRENAIMVNLRTTSSNNEAWIGLRNTSFDTTAREYTHEWLDGSALTYSNWRNDYDRGYPCVFLHANSKWRGKECNQEMLVICQKMKTVTECPTGWYRSFSRKSCYRHVGSGTIIDAIQQCSFIDNVAAEVAMPKTQQQNGLLNFLMKLYLLTSIHIGLESTLLTDWTWFSGEKLADTGYSAWISGTPFPYIVQYATMMNKKWTNHYGPSLAASIICQCHLLTENQTPLSGRAYCTLPVVSNTVPFTQETTQLHLTTVTSEYTGTTQLLTEDITTENSFSTSLSSSITSSPDPCVQECPCYLNSENSLTSNALDQRIRDIKANLTVEKSILSKTIRKLTCAEDPRVSSRYIGYLGAVMIIVIFGLLIFMDCFTLATYKCR